MTMLQKVESKLRQKKGASLILAIVLIAILFLTLIYMMEYRRVRIISAGVRNAMEQAVTSVAINNAYNSFNGVREGNSGAYELSGEDWRENVSTIDVQNKLVGLLHLQSKNGVFISPNPEGDSYEFAISEVDVIPDNAEFASNTEQAKYLASCRVEIPFSLGFEAFPPLVIRMEHQSVYVDLFD